MPSLLQSVLLLALLTFVLAAPAPGHIQKRSFKVDRVRNPNFRRAVNHVRAPGAGTRAMIRAHRKFSVPLPPGLLDAMNQAGVMGGSASAAGGAVADVNGLSIIGDLIGDLTGAGAGAGGKKSAAAAAAPAATKTSAAAAKGTGTATKGTGTTPKGTGKAPKGTGTAKSSAAAPKGTGSSSTGSSGNSTTAGASGNAKGVVTATPEQGDIEYLSPVTIGGQTINMDFDSGSSDLWVFNTQLSTASQTGHTVYDPTKSANFKLMQGATFSISYGDGSGAAGTVGADTVNIGGVSVTSQAVEIPTAVSSSFVQDANSNGLVGLAFSKLNTVKPTQQKTFFDNAMPNLAEPVFTADLRAAAVGSYEFGNIDASKFNGSLTWAAVNTTQGFWQFSSSTFTVGGGAAMTVTNGQAIADTGTTLMLVDAAVINAYYSTVQGAVNNATVGGVTFPCSANLPDLQVDVGGTYMANIKGKDINFAPVDAAGTTCFGGVQAIASDLQIYGDILFKSQFVAFNGGNNSIGMAPHQ